MAKEIHEGLAEPLTFSTDESTKRKKGAHKPVFAKVFVEADVPYTQTNRIHLLVNPFAGKKKGREVAKKVIEAANKAGVEITCSYSSYSGHLITMASALVVDENDLIAVVGGDGSFSEVLTGRMLLGKSEKETFAIVPAGTGNSQAHDLGIGSVQEAIETMLTGKKQALDLARVELTEGLPGATGDPCVRYSHNLGLGVWALIQPSRRRKCDGWAPSGTTSASSWRSSLLDGVRPHFDLTTVSSPTTSRFFWCRTVRRAAPCSLLPQVRPWMTV